MDEPTTLFRVLGPVFVFHVLPATIGIGFAGLIVKEGCQPKFETNPPWAVVELRVLYRANIKPLADSPKLIPVYIWKRHDLPHQDSVVTIPDRTVNQSPAGNTLSHQTNWLHWLVKGRALDFALI